MKKLLLFLSLIYGIGGAVYSYAAGLDLGYSTLDYGELLVKVDSKVFGCFVVSNYGAQKSEISLRFLFSPLSVFDGNKHIVFPMREQMDLETTQFMTPYSSRDKKICTTVEKLKEMALEYDGVLPVKVVKRVEIQSMIDTYSDYEACVPVVRVRLEVTFPPIGGDEPLTLSKVLEEIKLIEFYRPPANKCAQIG